MVMEGHEAVHISSDLPTVSLLAILCTNPCNLWLVPTKGNLSIGLVPTFQDEQPMDGGETGWQCPTGTNGLTIPVGTLHSRSTPTISVTCC